MLIFHLSRCLSLINQISTIFSYIIIMVPPRGENGSTPLMMIFWLPKCVMFSIQLNINTVSWLILISNQSKFHSYLLLEVNEDPIKRINHFSCFLENDVVFFLLSQKLFYLSQDRNMSRYNLFVIDKYYMIHAVLITTYKKSKMCNHSIFKFQW